MGLDQATYGLVDHITHIKCKDDWSKYVWYVSYWFNYGLDGGYKCPHHYYHFHMHVAPIV